MDEVKALLAEYIKAIEDREKIPTPTHTLKTIVSTQKCCYAAFVSKLETIIKHHEESKNITENNS